VKRLVIAACLAGCALGAWAEDAAESFVEEVGADETVATTAFIAPPPGYAFDRPELLADQYLWGIAHGARLLAQACAVAGHAEAHAAWQAWNERETPEIAACAQRLGRHYYQRDDVAAAELVVALHLKPALDIAPERLEPACATLPAALARPRYDLARRREEMLKK
jgi:hypothetical protein